MIYFIRFCPICEKELKYKTEIIYKIAELKNNKCKSCSHIGKKLSDETKEKMSKSQSGKSIGRKLSEDAKKNMSKSHIGKKASDETKEKMSKSHLGHKVSEETKLILRGKGKDKIFSEETRKKISKSQLGKIRSEEYKLKMSIVCQKNKLIGEKSPNFGKKASDETKEKMSKSQSGRIVSDETKIKISNGNKGKIRSEEYKMKMSMIKKGQTHTTNSKLKMRLSRIKEIESKCGQVIPNYNKKACQYFNNIIEKTGVNIQHAENGGEYNIKELGYWVDGYDKENNIVYEYDEKHHFNKKERIFRDIEREKEIIKHLNCKFIRIKDEK